MTNKYMLAYDIAVKTGVFTDDELECLHEELMDLVALSAYPGDVSDRTSDLFLLSDDQTGFAMAGPLDMTKGSYMLYWIAVEPSFHGKMVAQELLTKVEAYVAAAGGKRIFIETSSTDKFARPRNFYFKSGYYHTAILMNYYSEGDSKCVFLKTL